jgi:uncharacterized cysteine cluster protein YcgN (CxxCxxCC family)
MSRETPSWVNQPLQELDSNQWELLCDRCGRCCLIKLEDEETGELAYTDVACHLLDGTTVRCRQYADRHRVVPNCLVFNAEGAERFDWLPETCAYRRRAAGLPLPSWHPLVSGDPESVHRAGFSVQGRIVSEQEVDEEELEDHVTHDFR